MEKDVGSLEPEKLADVVVLNSDPLADVSNVGDVAYVIKSGAEVVR